mmetsp:Transcript_4944/g.15886  ORF Transcript_4944/g.15886 Transcript_4944/m.15886 type:complete len:288 (+) Transcript_4944:116-979(+)
MAPWVARRGALLEPRIGARRRQAPQRCPGGKPVDKSSEVVESVVHGLEARPDLEGQAVQVQARGAAFHAHAAVDEVVYVDAPDDGVVGCKHLKEHLDVLYVYPQHLEVSLHPAIPDGRLHFLDVDGARAVDVQLVAEVAQLRDLDELLLPLLQRQGLAVRLRQLQGVLHEHARQDVEKSDLDEGDEEYEEGTAHHARPFNDRVVKDVLPVSAAGRGLEQAQHGLLDGAQRPVDLALARGVELLLILKEVGRGALDEDQGEDVEDKTQHDEAPEEGDEGPHDGVEHKP